MANLVLSIAQDWQEQVSWIGENMWSGWMVIRKIQVIRIEYIYIFSSMNLVERW